MKENKTYWKGLEQLEATPDFQERSAKEFPEYLPINGNEEGDPTRRDFLKMMGFGMAAVSLAACEAPVRKAIPYVNKPVDVDPGVANYYASTYSMGNDYCSVVVKTREGRPIKIEGNSLSKVSGGGTTTQVEASILSLYDEQRLKNPKIGEEDTTWEELDNRIKAELGSNSGKTVIVSYSNCSPSTQRAVDALNAKYGNVEWVQYDPLSMSGLLDAYEVATGSRALPVHDFSKAKTIVSFGADFLGNWPNQAMNNRQFASSRKLSDDKKEMSRLYSFESNLSLTGSNADYRDPIKPSQEGLYVANLYNLLAQKAGTNAVGVPKVESTVVLEKAASDLWNSKESSLVLSGSNDPSVQKMVIAINDLLGAYGTTIDASRTNNTRKGDDNAFSNFVNDLKQGQVGAVLFYNCNPVYDHPMGSDISGSIGKAKTSISTTDRNDETTAIAKYLAPDHHYLESWNDFEPITGQLSLSQPTISNIFNTRQAQESFLRWSDNEDSYYDFIRSGWTSLSSGDFDGFWDQCLHDGVFENENAGSALSINLDVTVVATEVKNNSKPSSGTELVLYANYSVGDGIQANNPWLQEMPDPITKACWDNYLTVPLKYAKENGLDYESGRMKAKLVTLSVNGSSIQVPVIPQPGQAEGTVGLALGYGRTNAGKVADNLGVNAYNFVGNSAAGLVYNTSGVSLSGSEGEYQVAQTQTSQTYAGRETVIQETVLKDYQKDPQAGRYFPEISTADGKKKPYAISLWKDHKYDNHHWGMTVDLNSCTGCGTCTIACQTENNIPVVGKQEVLNRREMHWIRIDRYYSSTASDKEKAAENPEVTFQPMMCQHCNAAPCETVCPVAATTHSTEGLNMMAYNRCVGTRYCANNCPYKVRRFNWFKYHDNAQFDTNTAMNNDLGKMVLNPDVTVRSRGVMEKCSFCVQRIQAGKLQAKKESRRPEDGEITTACVKACPADALVFGDMKDPNSKIYQKLKIKEKEKGVEAKEPRAYHVLEELRVMPNVWYLTKVRNKDENKEKVEA
ncbi:MAG: TAT-variant-translocated molybdopterin oxidoreductase [Cyclobacteriaceae bacterium]